MGSHGKEKRKDKLLLLSLGGRSPQREAFKR